MSKMDGQLLQAEKFFAVKECTSLATVFGKSHKKDNKLSFLLQYYFISENGCE